MELTAEHRERLAGRSRQAGLVGAKARRDRRRTRQYQIYNDAMKAIGAISPREVWLMGTVLYWAEGAKEKEYRPGRELSLPTRTRL